MAGGGTQDRILIIDEGLNKRLRTELTTRGRPAFYIKEDPLNLGGCKDDQLVAALVAGFPVDSIILVTNDDAMPGDHLEALTASGLHVATIDPDVRGEYSADPGDAGLKKTQEEWKRETVHRWAHRMAVQTDQFRRYSPYSSRAWKLKD